MTPIQLYRKAAEEHFNSERWNCLCWNCNCGRSQNNTICPHKDVITKEMYIERYSHRAEYKVRPQVNRVEEAKEVLLKNMSKEDMMKFMEMLKVGLG